jgi:hypothetical protein
LTGSRPPGYSRSQHWAVASQLGFGEKRSQASQQQSGWERSQASQQQTGWERSQEVRRDGLRRVGASKVRIDWLREEHMSLGSGCEPAASKPE